MGGDWPKASQKSGGLGLGMRNASAPSWRLGMEGRFLRKTPSDPCSCGTPFLLGMGRIFSYDEALFLWLLSHMAKGNYLGGTSLIT